MPVAIALSVIIQAVFIIHAHKTGRIVTGKQIGRAHV